MHESAPSVDCSLFWTLILLLLLRTERSGAALEWPLRLLPDDTGSKATRLANRTLLVTPVILDDEWGCE